MKNWLLNRLREKSTWAALLGFVAAVAGYTVGDEQIATIAAGIAALIGVFVAKESGDPTTPANQLTADDLVSLREFRALQSQRKSFAQVKRRLDEPEFDDSPPFGNR